MTSGDERATTPRARQDENRSRSKGLAAELAVLPLGRLDGVAEHDGGREHDATRRPGTRSPWCRPRRRSRRPSRGRTRRWRRRTARSPTRLPRETRRAMRARRSSTGSTLAPSATGPACRIEEPAQVVGEAVEAEVGARHGRVVVVELVVGVADLRGQEVGVGTGRTIGSRARAARRPPGSDPPRRDAGGWRLRSVGCRSPPTSTGTRPRRRPRRRPPSTRATVGGARGTWPPRRMPRSVVLVAVLGRTEEPVGGVERLGQRHGGGHVLSFDRAHGVEHESLVRPHAERAFGSRRDLPAGSSTSKPL